MVITVITSDGGIMRWAGLVLRQVKQAAALLHPQLPWDTVGLMRQG